MHTYNRKPRSPGSAFLIALSATAIGVLPLSGQSGETDPWQISFGQVASIVGALGVGFIPRIFSINDGLPTCAPCDPATLPGIDRWAVSTERTEWDLVSDVGILVLAGATWYDLSNLSNRNGDVAASIEATAWTFGVNQLVKAIVNRNRPVLYSEDAIEHRESVNSHRSMYSAHASTSFALGTSYFLSMDHKDGLSRTWPSFPPLRSLVCAWQRPSTSRPTSWSGRSWGPPPPSPSTRSASSWVSSGSGLGPCG